MAGSHENSQITLKAPGSYKLSASHPSFEGTRPREFIQTLVQMFRELAREPAMCLNGFLREVHWQSYCFHPDSKRKPVLYCKCYLTLQALQTVKLQLQSSLLQRLLSSLGSPPAAATVTLFDSIQGKHCSCNPQLGSENKQGDT